MGRWQRSFRHVPTTRGQERLQPSAPFIYVQPVVCAQTRHMHPVGKGCPLLVLV